MRLWRKREKNHWIPYSTLIVWELNDTMGRCSRLSNNILRDLVFLVERHPGAITRALSTTEEK